MEVLLEAVILIDNFSVIGIHKGYLKDTKQNIGIFINNIINDIKSKSIFQRNFRFKNLLFQPIGIIYEFYTTSLLRFSLKDFQTFNFNCPLWSRKKDYWYLCNDLKEKTKRS